MRGTKGVCKERGRKTKRKSKEKKARWQLEGESRK
jgi:hypothetical protein